MICSVRPNRHWFELFELFELNSQGARYPNYHRCKCLPILSACCVQVSGRQQKQGIELRFRNRCCSLPGRLKDRKLPRLMPSKTLLVEEDRQEGVRERE